MQKDAKTLRAVKQTKTKKAFERLATLQKDLQTSVAEVRWMLVEEIDSLSIIHGLYIGC